jgi:hypothetical protein
MIDRICECCTIHHRIVVRVLLASFCALANPAPAQERTDIVQIWTNFLASRAAALGCNGVNPATEVQFASTLQAVSLRAAMALKERNAQLPEDELALRTKRVIDGIKDSVNAEIAKNGCGSERIRQLLKLYDLHSRMTQDLKIPR